MKRTPLARRRGLPREGSQPLARRRAALAKRGRNYARNRREQFGVDGKREWIVGLPCLVCQRTPCEPHHEPPRSLGGKAEALTPLCVYHHFIRHALGHHHFALDTGVDLLAEAARLELEWAA